MDLTSSVDIADREWGLVIYLGNKRPTKNHQGNFDARDEKNTSGGV